MDPRTHRLRQILSAALAGVAYFATGWLGLIHPAIGTTIATLWLPSGIAVGALLRLGRLAVIPVFLASCPLNLSTGLPVLPTLFIAIGNTLGPFTTVVLLRKFGFRSSFAHPRDILLLSGSALGGMLLAASGGVAALGLAERLAGVPALQAWLMWWAADTLGVVLGAPLALKIAGSEWASLVKKRTEFTAWGLCTIAVCWAVFFLNGGGAERGLALAYLPLPFVAWAALRFGTLGAALSVIATSMIAVYGTGEGRGPFQHTQPFSSALIVWIYMATTTTLAWMISAIQTSHERISAARQLLERALSDSALGVILTDTDRKITYANDGFRRITGYSESESLGRNWSLLKGPATDPDTTERLTHHLDKGQPFEGEIISYRRDRSQFWDNLTVSPIHDESAQLDGFMFIHRDITARKLAEQAVIESESHFRRLIEFAPEAVVLLDLDSGRFTEANDAARRLFKLSAEALRELNPSKISPASQPGGGDSETLAAYWIGKALGGEIPVFEWTHLDSEGSEVLCEVRLLRLDIQGRTYVRGSLTPIAERKRAENALKESELRYRTLFESNPQPMWVFDIATKRILAVNDAAVNHYLYSRDEFLAFTTDDFRAPAGPWSQEIESENIERHQRKDHSVIEVEVSSHELNFDGRASRMVLAHDVTERRRAAIRAAGEREVLELLASDAPLTTVLERITINHERAFPGMLCSVLLLDDDGQTLRHGAAPSLPKAYCDAIDGARIGPSMGSCGTAAYTKKTVIADDIASDPRWVNFSALALGHGLRACWSVPLISSGDTVLGTLALYYREPAHPTDIESTAIERGAHFASIAIERQKLRQSVHENRIRLETLVKNLPGMAYRCRNDDNWTMTYVSDGCRALTGFERDELENNKAISFAELIHPNDREWLWEKCQASLEARIPCTNEYRIINRDGTERWVAERASGEYAPDGALLSIDGFIQDITDAHRAKTEREQLDRKMQDAQKLESLGVLAGGIAHDFNNLLTSILGNASIASMSIPAGSDAYNSVDQIITASMRAADLCKQMLAYSGRGRFVLQRLDLSELVEQTTQMLQISISKKAVLRFHLEKGLPAIEADATQIRQIVMNLVINASEAIGDQSGIISLSTGLTRVDRDYLRGTLADESIPDGEYVSLEVSDSGCGMSPETKAKIFDPFFTTKFTGRGLGLAAVLGIVRGHRGSMKVYSEPGRGTTFKILFPATGGAAEKQDITPGAVKKQRYSGTVLIIDDEETVRSTVCRMMEMLGFECILAADGRQGVDIAAKDPSKYSLVLLDLTMPHMDGEQAFAELRRIRSDFRVVLMSGFNAQEALVKFSGKGLASFLQKPFSLSALRAILNEVLG